MKGKRQRALPARHTPASHKQSPGVSLVHELPLISCVMSTAGRPEFVAQSVRLFGRQDYPSRELIIVDDGAAVAANFTDDPRIRCLRLPAGQTNAGKLHFGFDQARGAVLALWDDGEWFGTERLSYQVGPLLAGQADIVGLKPGL